MDPLLGFIQECPSNSLDIECLDATSHEGLTQAILLITP